MSTTKEVLAWALKVLLLFSKVSAEKALGDHDTRQHEVQIACLQYDRQSQLQRNIYYTGVILHDVAKCYCTLMKPLDENMPCMGGTHGWPAVSSRHWRQYKNKLCKASTRDKLEEALSIAGPQSLEQRHSELCCKLCLRPGERPWLVWGVVAQWYRARLTSKRSPVWSPAALNMLRRRAPRQGTLLTHALSRPRSKWVPGRTVKACEFE